MWTHQALDIFVSVREPAPAPRALSPAFGAGIAALALLMAACGGGGASAPAPAPVGTSLGCVGGTERLDIVSGNAQIAAPGSVLPEQPTVRLTCESFANRGTTLPLAGQSLEWSIVSGRGRVDGAATVTHPSAADGTSSVAWTLANSYVDPQSIAVHYRVSAIRQLRVEFNASIAGTTTTALNCQDPGGTPHGATTLIASDAAWSAAGSPHRGDTITLANGALLSIERGAVVCVAGIDAAASSGDVAAFGTEQAPIRFFGTALRVAGELRFVQGDNMPAVGSADRPLWGIADSRFDWSAPSDPLDCVQVVLNGGGNGAQRSVISRYGSADCAALQVTGPSSGGFYDYGVGASIQARIVDSVGDALGVAGDTDLLSVANCEISASGRHGIVVRESSGAPRAAGSISVTGCNLFGNAGNAIANQSTVAIEAPANWWGDAAGPTGTNGDGVSGPVDATNPRAAPVALGY